MAWRQSEHDGLKRSAEVSGVSDSESHRQCATAYKLPPSSPREPAEGARVRWPATKLRQGASAAEATVGRTLSLRLPRRFVAEAERHDAACGVVETE